MQLEFRDSVEHFHGQDYERGEVGKGHEWMWAGSWSQPCTKVGCDIEAVWMRATVDHINFTTMDFLCKSHGAETWKAIPHTHKAAVLVVRDWDDEFAEVVFQMPAPGADFPGLN